jgi:hypothetical protein
MSTDTHTDNGHHVTGEVPKDPMERAKARARRISDAVTKLKQIQDQEAAARATLVAVVAEGQAELGAAKRLSGGPKAFVEAEIGQALAQVPASIRVAAKKN